MKNNIVYRQFERVKAMIDNLYRNIFKREQIRLENNGLCWSFLFHWAIFIFWMNCILVPQRLSICLFSIAGIFPRASSKGGVHGSQSDDSTPLARTWEICAVVFISSLTSRLCSQLQELQELPTSPLRMWSSSKKHQLLLTWTPRPGVEPESSSYKADAIPVMLSKFIGNFMVGRYSLHQWILHGTERRSLSSGELECLRNPVCILHCFLREKASVYNCDYFPVYVEKPTGPFL